MSHIPANVQNFLADEQKNRVTHFSLHTASAAPAGANEAFGGLYARQAANWAAAGAVGPLGAAVQPATVGVAWGSATFSVNSGSYSDIGFWDALTAGNYEGSDDMTTVQTLASAGSIPNISIAVGPGVV